MLKLQACTFPAFHRLGGDRERSASDRLQMTAQAKARTTDSRTREMLLVNGDSRSLSQGIVTVRVRHWCSGAGVLPEGAVLLCFSAAHWCWPCALEVPLTLGSHRPCSCRGRELCCPTRAFQVSAAWRSVSWGPHEGPPAPVGEPARGRQGPFGGKAPTVTPCSDPGVGRRACAKRALISSSPGCLTAAETSVVGPLREDEAV